MDIKTKYFKQKETRLILKNKADISQKKKLQQEWNSVKKLKILHTRLFLLTKYLVPVENDNNCLFKTYRDR